MIAALLLLVAGAAGYPRTITVDDGKPMLCLDSTNTYQPMQRTNFGLLRRSIEGQYKFRATVQATSPTRGLLVFRGGAGNGETITYVVSPQSDGLALISMKVRLHGASDDLSGNDMCWRVFAMLNGE